MGQHRISWDPASIPEKAKAGFSFREFGYIAAEQYCRLNGLQGDDGVGARSDIETGFGMHRWPEERAGEAFIAGWNAYMIEHQRGNIYHYYKGEE